MGQRTHLVVTMDVPQIALIIQRILVAQIVRQIVPKTARQNAITIVRQHALITAMGAVKIRVAEDASTLMQVHAVLDAPLLVQ